MITQLVRFTISAAATTLELLPNGIQFYAGGGAASRPLTSGEDDAAQQQQQPQQSQHHQPQLNLAVFMILFILCACEVIFLKILSALSMGTATGGGGVVGSRSIITDGLAAINAQRLPFDDDVLT